jgi:hypothetical protein
LSLAEWTFRVRDYVTLNPWVITLAMVLGGGLLIGFLVIMKARKGAPEAEPGASAEAPKARVRRYEFRLCIVGAKHRWIKTIQESLTFTYVDKGPQNPMKAMYDRPQSYDIDPTVSYELAPSLGQRLGMFLRRIDTMFLVVFREGDHNPITYQAPKRSAYVLKTIEESTALSEGLKKEFAGEFSVKQLFIYMILIIVGVLAYMFISGQLVIG